MKLVKKDEKIYNILKNSLFRHIKLMMKMLLKFFYIEKTFKMYLNISKNLN